MSDFHVGNASTNTIGAMNTGETTVAVDGANNIVDVSTAADSVGCQNGSILSSVLAVARPLVVGEDGAFVPSGELTAVNMQKDLPGCS